MKIIAESCRAVCVEIDNNSMLRVLPRIKVKESEKWIKHVRCDGHTTVSPQPTRL
jgi:hypothetical protein